MSSIGRKANKCGGRHYYRSIAIQKMVTNTQNQGKQQETWPLDGVVEKERGFAQVQERRETKRRNLPQNGNQLECPLSIDGEGGYIGVVPAGRGVRASRYLNPVLPGFHLDPSCIYVEELNETFFCVTSSFSVFPGIPIHASKSLTNWKLASNVLNRPSQLPEFASTPTGQDGIFAPTLRYHNGTF